MTLPRTRGFTLIELLIVVTIIAILAAIALPSYNRYGFRARRAESRELLMRMATAQERFFSNFNRYAATLAELGFTVAQPPCGVIGASENCHYIVSIGGLGAGNATYTLTATPQGPQAADKCLNLMINNMGQKTASGTTANGNCW